jgi:pimeloyl-ACP methyl ester carboxylesterase
MQRAKMDAALRRSAWIVAAAAWMVLATHVLSARAIVERERIGPRQQRQLNLPGRLVLADGHRSHVVERGEKGGTVILVHGLGGSTADWEEKILARLSRDNRVVALDLFGFGYSDRDPEFVYDLPLWSAQLGAVIKALGVRKATLVGQSLGAAVVAEYAARSRRRVDQLVLLSPLDPEHWVAPIQDAGWMRLPILGEAFVSQLDHLTRDPEYSARHHARARHASSIAGTRDALLDCLRTPPALGALPTYYAKIRVPSLVLRGERDRLVNSGVARAAAKTLRGGQLGLVPGAGHLLTRDQPAEVADTIVRFVAAKRALDKRRKAQRRAAR